MKKRKTCLFLLLGIILIVLQFFLNNIDIREKYPYCINPPTGSAGDTLVQDYYEFDNLFNMNDCALYGTFIDLSTKTTTTVYPDPNSIIYPHIIRRLDNLGTTKEEYFKENTYIIYRFQIKEVISNHSSYDYKKGDIIDIYIGNEKYLPKVQEGSKFIVFLSSRIASENSSEEPIYSWDNIYCYYVTPWNAAYSYATTRNLDEYSGKSVRTVIKAIREAEKKWVKPDFE